MNILLRVKWVKRGLVMTVLAIWVLAANHCRLELMPAFAFLTCCEHEATEQPAGHHEDDCEDDICAVIEGSFYRSESSEVLAVKPVLAWLVFLLPSSLELESRESTGCVLPAGTPRELPQVWQFTFRTALPPRAPSTVS